MKETNTTTSFSPNTPATCTEKTRALMPVSLSGPQGISSVLFILRHVSRVLETGHFYESCKHSAPPYLTRRAVSFIPILGTGEVVGPPPPIVLHWISQITKSISFGHLIQDYKSHFSLLCSPCIF